MQKQDFQTINKRQNGRFALTAAIGLLLMITFVGTNAASAQTRKAKGKISKQTNYKLGKRKVSKVVPLQDNTAEVNQPLPITVVNTAETDYLSGEASVVVNPKQPTVVRLGLSQNAVSIVEFPASDGVYYIHEGNPKLVSVFQSPTRESDRSITIYPGEGFVSGRESSSGERNPSATITLQMRSGLILILEFVPVSDLRKNAHRCVINYNRDEVIAARRSAGLAFNLGEDVKPTNGRNTRASSKLVSSAGDEKNANDETDTNESGEQQIRLASLVVTRGAVSRKNDKKSKQNPKTGLELSRLVNKRLAECLKNPAKNLGAFSPAANGLSLAVSSVAEIDAEQRLVIVAVRNNAAQNLRLVPGTPELQIQTADDKGNALQTERLERTYVETTSFEGLIQPGSTVYYALVYNAPVMGASQRLRVLVSHREAADTPTTVVLPNADAIEE